MNKAWSAAAAVIIAAATTVTAAATAAPADAAVSGPWVSIHDGPQYSPPLEYRPSAYPHTGASIFASASGSDERGQCTVSWPVQDAEGDEAFLTAGHCVDEGEDQLWIRTRDDETVALPRLWDREKYTDASGIYHDSARFYLPYGAPIDDPKVAPGVAIRGVMTVGEVSRLAPGTPMCMNGARSGLSCGPFARAYSDAFEWHGTAVHGDSGAPLFVVNADGDAMAVGMLSSGPTDTLNYATYLYPVLEDNDLKLILSY
ncbi:S1 family peptidase [Mycolicibacillus koreensis]|uniref:S1 family peptidase n=1 Tax=Mycolicibacillus koreensis TaxID=1069220 RepID=UPI00138D5106|nr:S1 family peptidase [Mycolicibacillus koreensis]BBY53937.1 hypothetical protein MKOR_11880 [Mycolicibacillus koreensis]